MSDKAYITPKVLKWARESARMSVETAAGKVNVSSEKLITWESGENVPTIKQAEYLAKVYKRSFALFFLPEVPTDFQPLTDFRVPTSTALGTASTFIIREIQQKQSWISDVFKDNNQEPLSFVGRFSIRDRPQAVAMDIIQTLNIQLNYPTGNPIKEWIDKAETQGIFVSRTSFIHSRLKIDSSELQGFAIADPYAPFVFVNSEDWDAPQLFTIVHEIAHLWIAQTGISNDIIVDISNKDAMNAVELFCNEVAANALMPFSAISDIDIRVFNNGDNVFKTAKRLGVSSLALLYRVYSIGIISLDRYRILKTEAENQFKIFLQKEEEKALLQKTKKGGPDYYLLKLNKNGRLFTQIVLDAFRGGLIEPTQASSLLNVQVNKFPKLEAYF